MKLRQGVILTFIQIIDLFTFYGVDIAILAAATAIITQVLKITILKKVQKKILTFLPFTLGTLLYAVYAGVRNMSAVYVIQQYAEIIERGLAIGSLATLLYVLYEQFIRQKSGLSETEQVVSALIQGFVPDDGVEEVAKKVTDAILKDVTGNGAKLCEEIIADNAAEGVTERDVQLLSKLIIETLAHMTVQ